MKRILISAGEVSGDLQGALLVQAVRKLVSDVVFEGFGGRFLREQGVTILEDFTHRSSVGFSESVPYLFDHLSAFRNLEKRLKCGEDRPDLFIFIDNQGFNIPLSAMVKKYGIPTLYYFPPQISIWGKWNGEKLRNTIDYFFVPFYADYQEYLKHNDKVYFYGHPFFDQAYLDMKMKEEYTGPAIDGDYYFLLPGSRQQELSNLLEIFLKVADHLWETRKLTAILPVSNEKFRPYIERHVKGRTYVILVDKTYYTLYQNAKLAIMASGSATLEALLLNIPHIVCYRISPLSFFIGKMLVKARHVGMSNILAGEEIATELLQKKASVPDIIATADKLLEPDTYAANREKLLHVRNELSAINKSSALDSYAQKVVEILGKGD